MGKTHTSLAPQRFVCYPLPMYFKTIPRKVHGILGEKNTWHIFQFERQMLTRQPLGKKKKKSKTSTQQQ